MPVIALTDTGLTVYVVFINSQLQFFNDTLSVWETYNAANWGDYALLLSEIGAGIYGEPWNQGYNEYYIAYKQIGGAPATTDTMLGFGDFNAVNFHPDVNEVMTSMTWTEWAKYMISRVHRIAR